MENKLIIRAFTVSQSLGFIKAFLPGLKEKYDVKLICSPEVPIENLVKAFDTDVIPVKMNRRITPLKDLLSLWMMNRIFRKEKPIMVHSMTPNAGLVCMIAGWISSVPVRVHTFTGLIWPTSTGLKRKVLMLTDRITCACATHIIPEGEGVKSDLIAGKITKKPLKVLGYGSVKGVDMEWCSRRPEVMKLAESLRREECFTFLYVGRIVKDKGINELCLAFERLHCDYPEARLLLVGPFEDALDPINEESREIISRNTAIEAVGPKRGDELLAYYATADCFVMPSYREGFPNTVLEAGAMGLPSIVTDINGSREIIVQGENGVIIPSQDINALYNAMLGMLKNRVERDRMAGNARVMIGNRFEQGYVGKCLYDFYDDILKPYV